MGSPDFAVAALSALAAAGHEIACVYAQPPKPAGRGQRETPCPVHQAAIELGLPVRTPKRLKNNADELSFFQALNLDAAIVAAYGLILPPPFLNAPRRGCLNIHASLLPRWRGAAPIQAAILAGDAETGITITQMDEGLDTGDMLLAARTQITPTDTAATLHDRLAAMGASLILKTLETAPTPTPQNNEQSTYAPKLSRENANLDFTQPATTLERQIRAYHPWPGSFTTIANTQIKILAATLTHASGSPGTILDNHLTIACGTGAITPTKLQRPGKSPMPTADFLRGFPIAPGTRIT